MHRIVTPTYISCTNSLLWFKRLMRLICTIEAQLKHRRVAVYTHQAAARETIHSHTPMPKTPLGGKTYEQQGIASPSGWGGNYL